MIATDFVAHNVASSCKLLVLSELRYVLYLRLSPTDLSYFPATPSATGDISWARKGNILRLIRQGSPGITFVSLSAPLASRESLLLT